MSQPTLTIAPNTTSPAEMTTIFAQQRAYAPIVARTTTKERKAKLRKLRTYIMANLPALEAALRKDFRKPASETVISEVLPILADAKHTIRHLGKWNKTRRVPMPLSLIGTSSHVRYDPKGQILILAPWNYPFNLTIGPLIPAIAAGNVMMIKPSEMTPHTSAFLRKMIEDLFDPREVALVEGDASVAQHLLSLPFNHIFFTGSPQVGKLVMKAAAEHLASVTLELGGKSPAVIDETADLKTIAERMAWGKCINNGQTCIAPDYVLVHESVKKPFIEQFAKAVEQMYGPIDQQIESDSYARIVNQRHFERVEGILKDALDKGATVEMGGQTDAAERFISPTLLTNVQPDMRIMQEEIFGPLLPVMGYQKQEEALEIMLQHEAPLALYLHSRNQRNIDYFLDRVPSGDVVINETMAHFGHSDLPFGGKNNSGIGKAHGLAGFREFSHERSVMIQKFGSLKILYPPYTDRIYKLLTRIMGWL